MKPCVYLILAALFLFSSALSEASSKQGKKHRKWRRPAQVAETVYSSHPDSSADSSYLQRILNLENRRISKDKFLVACLSHSSRRVVKAALLALGRIGDTSALDEMANFLSKRDAEYAETAAFALSIVGGDTAPKILSQSLVLQKDPRIKAAVLLGLGRVGLESSMSTLTQALLNESNPLLLDAAAEGLTLAWSGASETWVLPEGLMPSLVRHTLGSEPLAISAAAALSRYKGDSKLLPYKEMADALPKVRSLAARALILRALGKGKSPQIAQLLSDRLTKDVHLGTRIEAANALKGQSPSPLVLDGFKRILTSEPNRGVIIAALGTIAKFGTQAAPLADSLDSLAVSHASLWVRGTALKALARVAPEKARARATEWAKDLLHPIYSSAVSTFALLGSNEDYEYLAGILPDATAKVAVEILEDLSLAPEDNFPSSLKTALKRLPLRNDVGITSSVSQLAQQFKWKDFAVILTSSYPMFTQEDHIEGKLSILNALAAIGDDSQFSFLENVTNEKEKLVVVAAVSALKALGGKDLSSKIPLNSTITGQVPNWQDAKQAMHSEVVLKTTRGDIGIRMLDHTPATAYHFIQFIRGGFYTGKTFHRVVPDFVAQGGDPRGDGFGGPGFLIRDEVTAAKHLRGTLGIATAGRDTGGCQFFINTAPNLHLAGKYTLFGEVTFGMDVADRLEAGDKIISAKLK